MGIGKNSIIIELSHSNIKRKSFNIRLSHSAWLSVEVISAERGDYILYLTNHTHLSQTEAQSDYPAMAALVYRF